MAATKDITTVRKWQASHNCRKLNFIPFLVYGKNDYSNGYHRFIGGDKAHKPVTEGSQSDKLSVLDPVEMKLQNVSEL